MAVNGSMPRPKPTPMCASASRWQQRKVAARSFRGACVPARSWSLQALPSCSAPSSGSHTDAGLPQTTIESSLGIDNPANQPSASGNVPTTDYDLAVTASWDADLFGRLRSGALAARADAEAQAAALEGIKVAVVADTVLAYVDLCGATRSLAVVQEQVALQDRALTIIRSQLAAGEGSPLEASQAANLVASTKATIAPLEAAQANARYRLATLAGRPAGEARSNPVTCSAPPKLRNAAPVGDGTALLLRRPDIREAERRLVAATARIGVARADLYPS